jgi:hypothetical protein
MSLADSCVPATTSHVGINNIPLNQCFWMVYSELSLRSGALVDANSDVSHNDKDMRNMVMKTEGER